MSDISFTQLYGLGYSTDPTLIIMKVCFNKSIPILDKRISTEKVSKSLTLIQIYFFLLLFQNFKQLLLLEPFVPFLILIGVCLSFYVLLMKV